MEVEVSWLQKPIAIRVPFLDVIEQHSEGSIPRTSALYLESDLYQKKMGRIPCYQE